MPGERLDLSSDPQTAPPAATLLNVAAPSGGLTRFLGVHFECCDVYSRIYPNRDETAYLGNCPKCARQLRIGIGSGGTSARFFRAS